MSVCFLLQLPGDLPPRDGAPQAARHGGGGGGDGEGGHAVLCHREAVREEVALAKGAVREC